MSNVYLIGSGQDRKQIVADLIRKEKELIRIHRVRRALRTFNEKDRNFLRVVATAGVSFSISLWIRNILGIDKEIFFWGVAFINAIWAFALISRAFPSRDVYADRLNSKLQAYDPVDKHAYRVLQRQTKANGYILLTQVDSWLEHEHAVIEDRMNKEQKGPSFVDKDV